MTMEKLSMEVMGKLNDNKIMKNNIVYKMITAPTFLLKSVTEIVLPYSLIIVIPKLSRSSFLIHYSVLFLTNLFSVSFSCLPTNRL